MKKFTVIFVITLLFCGVRIYGQEEAKPKTMTITVQEYKMMVTEIQALREAARTIKQERILNKAEKEKPFVVAVGIHGGVVRGQTLCGTASKTMNGCWSKNEWYKPEGLDFSLSIGITLGIKLFEF